MVFSGTRSSGFVLALFLCGWALPASAAPSASERETARSLMADGDHLRSAGDPAGALQRFQAAHALMHVPSTGLAVAETQAQLGLLVEARGSALEVMNMPVAEAEPSVFSKARDAAATLASALEARVCTLKTRVSPEDAPYELRVDEVALPAAARMAPFKTNPGKHSVQITAPGYLTQTREVKLREGAVQQLEVELQIDSNYAEADAAKASLSARQAAYSMQLDDARQGGRTRGIIGLSVGGAALAAGLVTGFLSIKQTSDVKAFCRPDNACDPSQTSALQRANTLAMVANIAIPVGVVGIAYGLWELLTLPAAAADSGQAALTIDVLPNSILLRGTL